MRRFYLILVAIIMAVLIFGCDDNGTSNGDDPVKITDGMRYFPMQDGNMWFYNNGAIMRRLDGDTTINDVVCQRLQHFLVYQYAWFTEEAWTLTAERFAQHMLLGTSDSLWFDPPLQIPLDLEKGKPFDVNSTARFIGIDIDIAQFTGTLTFDGYHTVEVNDTMVDSCLKLDYNVIVTIFNPAHTDTSNYTEYYGNGLGLVFVDHPSDPWYLDSAFIDSVWVP